MDGLDVSHLTADDAVTALRSFPRRYRRALRVGDDEDVEELSARIGPDGTCALDHLIDATSSLMLLGRALHQALRTVDPLLHPAVADPGLRAWDPPPGLDVADLLDLLDDEVDQVVATAGTAGSDDWSRTARVADGPTLHTLDILREAARTLATDLRAAEAALGAARRA